MSIFAARPQKEMPGIGVKKSNNMLYSGTSLASVESLTLPLVCSLSLSPLSYADLTFFTYSIYNQTLMQVLMICGGWLLKVQEIVLSADIRCAECQKRLAEIMSRTNETESVLINVLEKKVTLTCRYPGMKVSTGQVAAVYRNPLGKMATIKRIFRSYSR
ncbi:hypothetical protein POTOM_031638 [Populus tomentosa]|uniref:HMA domain-containing protein n=1 Tax=Populus tomentosa TaxID=118781 RepID=A0A8X8CSR1_POPTO|nr:hypothetical protein POTOM_031638 [Populus tomentosa]